MLLGVTVAVLTLVVAVGDPQRLPAALRPAGWHGFTAVDLTLPVLLVMLGVVHGHAEGESPAADGRAIARVVGRAVLLVAVGVAAGWLRAGSWADARLPSLLGHVAVAELAAWLAWWRLSRRAQVLGVLGVLVGWWVVLRRFPVPGHGAGVVTPAGNLAGWVDRHVIGLAHLAGNTDPHGLLASVLSAVLVLAGIWTGAWLRGRPRGPATAIAMGLAGGYTALGGVLVAQVAPINPTLVTSAFLLLATGAALVALAVTYLLVEVAHGDRAARPVATLGRHGLVVLALAVLVGAWLQAAPAGTGAGGWLARVPHAPALPHSDGGTLVAAAAVLALLWAAAWGLDRGLARRRG